MAERRASRRKGKKLDSIISKLKTHTPVEEPSVPNEEKNENVDSAGEANVTSKKSKRKLGKILRYGIDGDDDDDNEKGKSLPENHSDKDENTNTKGEDDSLPKTIFEELPNGEADFEEGEDTTVLFLPSEEIQVKAGPSDDYCHGLLDDQEDGYLEGVEEERKRKEKKKKKKKSKSYESDESLDEDGLPRRVTCTACGRHVNPAHGTILRHPILNVLVCKKCNQYYNSGPFTRDEYGIEEQCRWCGDGGNLICCDECEKVYCKPCIQRNCGKTYLKNLLNAPEDFKWLCIVCNKDKPLHHIQRLRKKCEHVMEALDRVKAQKAHFKSKKGKQPSIVVGPTPLERRSRLTCLSEDIGIKGEGFSSSGESPTKKSFPKEDLPAELFSKTESEEENGKGLPQEKKKDGKKNKKDDVEEARKEEIEGEKERKNEKDEKLLDNLSSEEIDEVQEIEDVEDNILFDETPAENTSDNQEEVMTDKPFNEASAENTSENQEEVVKDKPLDEASAENTIVNQEEVVNDKPLDEASAENTSENQEDMVNNIPLDEALAENTSENQEDLVEQTQRRHSLRRLQSSDQSTKSDDTNEEENESNASTSSKTGKGKADSSDQEVAGRRKTRSQKDVTAEPKEKEISGDKLVVDREQYTSKGKKEKHSPIKKQTLIEIEEENGSPEGRVTRNRKEPKNKEEKTTNKSFPKEDLPAELFSKTESEEENGKGLPQEKKKDGKKNKKDDAEEARKEEIEGEKERKNEKDEKLLDNLSSEEIEEVQKTEDVEDNKLFDETPAENTSDNQEEVVGQTKRRRSLRRLQSSDQSNKSDDTNEEENESNASTSSKTGKAGKGKADSSDQEVVGRRKTRSQKDVTAEPKEKEISGDELVVDQEQYTSKGKKEKHSPIKKQTLIEIEEEDGSPEGRVTRNRKKNKNGEEKTTEKKKKRKVEAELSNKDVTDEKMDEKKKNYIQESSSDEDETKEKKDGITKKVKQELESGKQDSSEDFVPDKRQSLKSKGNANKVLQTKPAGNKKEIIVIESSEEEERVEKERELKGKGKDKKKDDETNAKHKDKTDVSLRLSRRNKVKETKMGKQLGLKKERDSSSNSESEKETKNVNKRQRKKESSKEKSIAEEPSKDDSIKEDTSDDDSGSEDEKTPLKKGKQTLRKKLKPRESSSESSENESIEEDTSVDDSGSEDERTPLKKRKQSLRKKPKARESSSESDIEKRKKSRKINVNKNNKNKKQLDESSGSESGLTFKKKKLKKELEENDYILDESSLSDVEKTSEESEEESESEAKTRKRKRGLQKQTRKRPRPIKSSNSASDEQSSEESDVGIAKRIRKRKQEESESSEDIGTKKQKRKKTKGKKSKNKRGKKRKIAFNSDEEDESEEESSENKSESSSESEEEEEKPKSRRSKRQKKTQKKKKAKKAPAKKKRRRRIRKNTDSDDDEDEDEPDDKSPGKGRRKIRKLLTDEKLGEETQKARRLEEERRKRLLERTRILEDEELPKESWHMSSLVLEKDDETKEPLVQVHKDLVQHLKPHQAKGIQFMYNNVVDTIKAYKKGDPGGGCILAHCMGLGKTLQVVALIHTLFNSDQLDFTTALIIAPLNTVLNWQVEFDKWLGVDDRIEVFVLKEAGANNWRRADMLKQWQRYGGVMIMGYDMYRNLALCNRTRSKHQKKIFKQTLADPGPDMVVCDEGHILRNDQSAISKTVNDIKTKRRVVLTGTPLQNNMIEYHCMMSFVKPNLLGTRREFMNTFGNPILNGQCADSTPTDFRLMKQRCHVLYKLLEGCVQRRDYSVLTPFLPPKHEYVLKIRLSEVQRKLYKHYLNTFVYPEGDISGGRGASLFSDYQALMRIWTHPWCLKLEAIRRSLRAPYEDTDDSLDGFVVHSDEEEEESEPSLSSDQSLSLSEDSDEGKNKRKNNNKPFTLESSSENESEDNTSDEEVMPQPSARRTTRSQAPSKTEETTGIVEVEVNGEDVKPGRTGSNTRSGAIFKEDGLVEEEKEWYDEFLTDEDEYNIELSGKMALLLEILADAEAVEEKVLVFSQSLVTLDLIERALGGGEVGGDRENWCRGCDYFRMDGSTSVQLRQRWADIFNDVDNKTARLFLISTKAGGLGINLVAANRVIVFDVSWNPSHDVQSVFRVFRFGQTRPVYVYRLVTQGTMEEKIYERQIAKLSISERVIDKHQIERHFTAADLAELYNFNPEVFDEEKDNENLPKLPLPKDAVLADIINRMHPKWIVKYHEHDSLLENVEGEELTEEECQMAWSAYEAQKDQAKNQERVRALQAAYAQQQLQQQRQANPQNSQHNNVLLREMQQLQQQQLSERMSRYQAEVVRIQRERQQFLAATNQNPMQQTRTDQLRHQLLQHVGASRPVYPVHAQSAPASSASSYQPMMSYLSQQQRQQQHVLGQPGPSNQVIQLPQSQPLSHPRPTAPPVTVLPPGTQYRR